MKTMTSGAWVCAGERYVRLPGSAKPRLQTSWHRIEGDNVDPRELLFDRKDLRGTVGLVHAFEWTENADGSATVQGGKGACLGRFADAQRCAEWSAAESAAREHARADRQREKAREHAGWIELLELMRSQVTVR
jgi:hypothetical protein